MTCTARPPAAGRSCRSRRSGRTGTSFTDTGLANGVTYYYTLTAVNAAGQAVSQANTGVPTDLYDSLAFDDGAGTTAADASGHGYSGTLLNGASWTTGKNGGA